MYSSKFNPEHWPTPWALTFTSTKERHAEPYCALTAYSGWSENLRHLSHEPPQDPYLSSELLHFHGAGHPYFSLSAMAFDLVLFQICLSVFQNCRPGQRFGQKAVPTANLAGIKTGIPITKGDQAARGGGTAGFTVSMFLTD